MTIAGGLTRGAFRRPESFQGLLQLSFTRIPISWRKGADRYSPLTRHARLLNGDGHTGFANEKACKSDAVSRPEPVSRIARKTSVILRHAESERARRRIRSVTVWSGSDLLVTRDGNVPSSAPTARFSAHVCPDHTWCGMSNCSTGVPSISTLMRVLRPSPLFIVCSGRTV